MLGGDKAVAKLSIKGATRSTGVASVRLRRARSDRYREAILELDAGGGALSADQLDAIRDVIAAEFPEGPGSWPLCWLAKCYLGVPFEVHMLDLSGQIVQHFKTGEALPGGLERGRRLAASGQYVVIEVFSDRMVAIAPDGTTAVMA